MTRYHLDTDADRIDLCDNGPDCRADHLVWDWDRRDRDEAIIRATFQAAWIARSKTDDKIIIAAEAALKRGY